MDCISFSLLLRPFKALFHNMSHSPLTHHSIINGKGCCVKCPVAGTPTGVGLGVKCLAIVPQPPLLNIDISIKWKLCYSQAVLFSRGSCGLEVGLVFLQSEGWRFKPKSCCQYARVHGRDSLPSASRSAFQWMYKWNKLTLIPVAASIISALMWS